MAPSFRSKKTRSSRDEEDFSQARGDRKARKPLVEKKRRARINESLQELRLILSETEFQTKMENAEVLELTVKRVQGILQSRSLDGDKMQREASERFAAGYIQCMHEVHTFVSNCPGIDSTIAAELLNHLLESMPLNEGSFQDLIVDVLSDPSISQRPSGDEPSQMPGDSHGTLSLSSLTSPLPSPSSSEEICSDLDNTETEQSHISLDGLDRSRIKMCLFPAFPNLCGDHGNKLHKNQHRST